MIREIVSCDVCNKELRKKESYYSDGDDFRHVKVSIGRTKLDSEEKYFDYQICEPCFAKNESLYKAVTNK